MRKFIITHEGKFKYGDVRMHKDLLCAYDICIGGGFYEFDYVSNRLLLSGASYDFGSPRWYDIEQLIIPSELHGMTILYENEPIPVERIKAG